MRLAVSAIVITLAVIFVAGAAMAEPARISRMKGGVEIMRVDAEKWTPAKPDLALSKGDRIRTKEDGKVELLFPDRTVLLIKEESEIKITRESDGGGGGSVKTLIGAVLLRVKASLAPSTDFQVDGSSALGVVRGTVLRVEVSKDGTSYWHGYESAVEVSNEKGNWIMQAGTNCRVDPFGLPVPGGCRGRTLAECVREFAIDDSDLAFADQIEKPTQTG